ncbi:MULTISPECIES: ATP12 family chaperone protein [unclassified Sphingobium]|uniref:ATP12 family chaperone protein n=1 Tax=unclassified Sphingobium TaxID=2611147 RepID=UPI0022248775|nr:MULTISPECIES: ATP12 family protein [unclassified Sphingobium]MCW2349555.1 chaperone required for assembly of F1-ATPase [Sphingobium sp. B12D2B]MCW2368659.1 chaperone required for assembly of F1-ATPase [Sphingobium sp. B11D3D]
MKRFWTSAQVIASEDGWSIGLDGRAVRTPARALLVVPGAALAQAIAEEWNGQGEKIDPATMPMTGFANATIDRVLPALGDFRGQVAAYAESDLLCYRADGPQTLIARQEAQWQPLLDWASERFGIAFVVTQGIIPVDQPALTLAGLRAAVEALDPWLLAGFATLVQISGTLVGSLALMEGRLSAEDLFAAASLDEAWQAEQWGEDAEESARLARRRADFLNAARYCALAAER